MFSLTQSNNPSWIGKKFSIRDEHLIRIHDDGFFGNENTLACYKNDQVVKFKDFDSQETVVAEKTKLGTIAGGVVGGVALGGFGAVIGALAGGNKSKKTAHKKIAMEFYDGNWIIIEFEYDVETMIGKSNQNIYEQIVKRYAKRIDSPLTN